jgi:hypothetical protein
MPIPKGCYGPPLTDEPRVHDVKLNPPYYHAVECGAKKFEIRENDRGYRVGDILILKEYFPETQSFSGRFLTRRITYTTTFHQEPGWIVLSLDEEAC